MFKTVLVAALATAGVMLNPGVAQADVFTMCPDGHEGVVGGHTTCPFAENVRAGFNAVGIHFQAYSPAMDQWYEVNCDPTKRPAYFEDGLVVSSWNCYASDNAEVVIW
jgi:hypothetical protein